MAQEHVESAERWIDAYNLRDVDALAELVTEDFEWITTNAGAVQGGSFRGRAGIESYFADVADTWEEYRVSAWELRDLGERVFASFASRRGEEAAVSRSRRKCGASAISTTAGSGVSMSFSITARRCGRRAWPSSRQVPLSSCSLHSRNAQAGTASTRRSSERIAL